LTAESGWICDTISENIRIPLHSCNIFAVKPGIARLSSPDFRGGWEVFARGKFRSIPPLNGESLDAILNDMSPLSIDDSQAASSNLIDDLQPADNLGDNSCLAKPGDFETLTDLVKALDTCRLRLNRHPELKPDPGRAEWGPRYQIQAESSCRTL